MLGSRDADTANQLKVAQRSNRLREEVGFNVKVRGAEHGSMDGDEKCCQRIHMRRTSKLVQPLTL